MASAQIEAGRPCPLYPERGHSSTLHRCPLWARADILRCGLTAIVPHERTFGGALVVEWFPKYETAYAERIYERLAQRERGDMTIEKLRLPREEIQRYREKALLYREDSSVCALLEIANRDPKLLPFLHEYVGFLEAKRVDRGLGAGREQLVRSAVEHLCDLFTHPIKWARRWLGEFRDDPDGVVLFANHWLRHYEALKDALGRNPTDPIAWPAKYRPPDTDTRR